MKKSSSISQYTQTSKRISFIRNNLIDRKMKIMVIETEMMAALESLRGICNTAQSIIQRQGLSKML